MLLFSLLFLAPLSKVLAGQLSYSQEGRTAVVEPALGFRMALGKGGKEMPEKRANRTANGSYMTARTEEEE